MAVVDSGAMGGAGVVIVFDFDKTILECDSDNWVVDELGANELFTHLLPTLPWNSLMVTALSLSLSLSLYSYYFSFKKAVFV